MKSKPTLAELQEIMKRYGGWLDLRDTRITSLPEGLTVGGWLDLRGTGITNTTNVKRLHNGDYAEGKYLYADNILTHVKYSKQIGQYTLYIGKIKGRNVVTDGTYYAHCSKWKDGIADLAFKAAKDRGAEQYKRLSAESIINKDDAITMYRVITGACRQGTQNFIESLGELKESYSVKEIIDLTKGQYGSGTFQKFFGGE